MHRLLLGPALSLAIWTGCASVQGHGALREERVLPATHGLPYPELIDAVIEQDRSRSPAQIRELRRRLCGTGPSSGREVVFYHVIRSKRWHHLWLCSRDEPHRAASERGARQLRVWLEWARSEHRTMLQGCSRGGDWLVWETEHASGLKAAVYCDGKVVLSLPGGARHEGFAVEARVLFPLTSQDRDEPALTAGGRGAEPAPPRPTPAVSLDADSFRLILSPTGRAAGARFSWTMTDFLVHQLDYSLSEHWQLGLQAILPVIYVGFLPQARYVTELGQLFTVGVQVTAGVFWPYVELDLLKDQFTHRFFLYGAGAFLTLKRGSLLLNLGLPFYGLRDGQKEYRYQIDDVTKQPVELSRTYYDNRFYAIPSLGGSWHVSRRIKLNLELHVPLSDFESVGRVWALLYGMRVLGHGVFFDINFFAPLFPGMADLYKYMPLGIPFVSFGLAR